MGIIFFQAAHKHNYVKYICACVCIEVERNTEKEGTAEE